MDSVIYLPTEPSLFFSRFWTSHSILPFQRVPPYTHNYYTHCRRFGTICIHRPSPLPAYYTFTPSPHPPHAISRQTHLTIFSHSFLFYSSILYLSSRRLSWHVAWGFVLLFSFGYTLPTVQYLIYSLQLSDSSYFNLVMFQQPFTSRTYNLPLSLPIIISNESLKGFHFQFLATIYKGLPILLICKKKIEFPQILVNSDNKEI